MSEQPETESLSLDDRIANKLDSQGDQPQEQPEQQADEPQEGDVESTAPEFEEVDFEGERYQVPPKLKDGLLRQSDYTRKTQELAQKQQAIEITHKLLKTAQQQQQFRESVKSDVEQLAMIDAYLKQPVDWANLSTEDMLRRRGELDQLKDRRAELESTLKQREQQFTSELQAQHEKTIKEVNEYLAKTVQGWSPETAKDVSTWAISQGFTQEELSSVVDPRHALILYKARQYDRLQEQKEQAQRTASKAPPLGKPGSYRPMPSDVKAKFAYQKAMQSKDPTVRTKALEAQIANKFR
jgi:hypothetical protein